MITNKNENQDFITIAMVSMGRVNNNIFCTARTSLVHRVYLYSETSPYGHLPIAETSQ